MSIALTTHKVAAAAVGVAMVFSFAFVTPAQAQTVEDLTAQINSLLSTIASLQAQLAGMTGGSTSGGSTCYNFTLNHKMGDQGGEVMNIQKFLNANGFTVSASGAGSAGNESSYFGAKTKAAVIAFQNANAASVLAPVGLSAGTGYWGSSSRSYANTMCTGTGTGTTPTVPTGTGLTVAAAAQPANGLAPTSAANLPFTKFTITNNSGSVQTVNNVTVQLGGLAEKEAFSSVVLLDESGLQVGNTRTFNSNDQASIGSTVTIQPGQTRTFTVAGNMGSALTNYAGQVATMSVIAVGTGATVSGSLPITGASHTINATLSIGAVTAERGVEDPAAAASKEIGTTDYIFTAVRLTNSGSNENVRLHSIRFDQAGSASEGDIVNVRAYIDGVAYTPAVDGDVYTFNFGSGIIIEEGKNTEIVLKGDIAGGTNRTVSFNVHKYTDIHVTGETYGYGITPTDGGAGFGSGTPAYDASDVTILAGTFNSVSKSNAAPAANIAEQKSGELLGAFTVDIKGEPITVQTMNFDITVDAGVTTRNITNVTLVDQNGTVLAGPVDSSTSLGSATTATDALTFTSVTLPTGVTTLFVKGQLDSDWVDGDTLAISTNPNSDWSDATGDTTGDTVTLPSTTATANTMTVQAATLSVTTLTQPAARSIVAGVTDFVFATVSLDASSSGEDIRVTALVLEDTLGDAGDDAGDIDNVEIWANLSGGTTNDSVRGDKYETRVADAEQFTDSGATDETLSITLDQHVIVKKGTSVEIAVVADLVSGATTGDTHTISVDTDASDVTAVGVTSGTSVSSSITPSGSGQTMTVSGGGTLTITVDSSSPAASLMLDDTVNEQTIAVFRAAASNVEAISIEKFKITGTGTSSNEVVSKYVFYNGTTKLGEVVNTGSTAELNMESNPLVVPANSNKLITVKAVMNDIDGTSVVNGNSVNAAVASTTHVTAKGTGGAAATVSGTGTSTKHYVYEAYPVVSFDNTGLSTTLVGNTNHLIAKILFSNPGDEDVTLNNADGNQLSVQITAQNGDNSNAVVLETLSLRDVDGNVLDSNETFYATTTTQVDFDFDGAYTAGFTVPAGGSKTMYLYANTADFEDNGDTIQAWLDDAVDDIGFGVDSTGDFSEGDQIFKGDIFGPAHINPS